MVGTRTSKRPQVRPIRITTFITVNGQRVFVNSASAAAGQPFRLMGLADLSMGNLAFYLLAAAVWRTLSAPSATLLGCSGAEVLPHERNTGLRAQAGEHIQHTGWQAGSDDAEQLQQSHR